MDAWGSIVEENRVGETMSFPLQEPDIGIKTASEVKQYIFLTQIYFLYQKSLKRTFKTGF